MRPEYRERLETAKQPFYEGKEKIVTASMRMPRSFAKALEACAEIEGIKDGYLMVNELVLEGIMRVFDNRTQDNAYMAQLSEENRQALEQVANTSPGS